jgi:alpha-galactosidase
MSFGLPIFKDIFSCPELSRSVLFLVDIDPVNLERMTKLAHRLNDCTSRGLKIVSTNNRRDALAGADFVISSIAIERCELWQKDFEIPKKYGVRHCLGENGGPGALFFTLRTIPTVLDIVRDMEDLCPDAYFLNFSNPESRVVLAVSEYTKIRCVGLCHGIFMGQRAVSEILGREYDSLSVLGAGMNHFQWLLSIRDKESGVSLYPEFWKKEAEFRPDFLPYSRRMARAFGLWPTCSDDHLGEYQAYGYEAGEHGYDFEQDARDRIRMAEEIAAITEAGPPEGWLAPSGERAVELILAIHYNRQIILPSAIIRNDGCITNLPPDVAVEVPIVADASGVRPMHIGAMPAAIADLLNMQSAPQRLSVLAAVKGSKEIALQALLCDPVINSYPAAVSLLDELWKTNMPYIRKCV